MGERTRIIVPHRGLAAAKTRLAPVLDPAERVELARTLLERVLRAAREACDDVVVISPSAALRPTVEATGARLAVQRGMGLNEGLGEARATALTEEIGLLAVLHGDLPNLTDADVRLLLGSVPRDGGIAIAPDKAGSGTNGLALRPPAAIDFHFGARSRALHLDDARARGVETVLVQSPGLAFDLDTPADLARWLELGDAA